MELLEQDRSVQQVPVASRSRTVTEETERAARRSLRQQIGRPERDPAGAFVTAYSMGGLDLISGEGRRPPRLLDLGGLERVRDQLAERLSAGRVKSAHRADGHAPHRPP